MGTHTASRMLWPRPRGIYPQGEFIPKGVHPPVSASMLELRWVVS